MKTLFLSFTAGWIFISTAAHGAETAQARLYCESPQFQQATASDPNDGGFQTTVNLTTLSSGINGELAPGFLNAPYTHSAYVQVYSEIYDDTFSGDMGLDVPSAAGDDGLPIFFEVAQGVTNWTSSGEIQIPGLNYDATFTATWNRAAGSSTGTCTYQVPDPAYAVTIQFTHTFTILEYTGPLAYTPGSNTISASINLTQTGDSSGTLQGPIVFDKSVADHFNTLTNRPGIWTNAAMQTLDFDQEVFARDANWPTNYAGYVFFADGDPGTTDPDYQLWVLSIDDTNDANANGIPDFSDDPASVTPPRPPQIALSQGATNLWLAISGDVGRTNLIQEIGSLISTNWQTTLSFVSTNDPQVISLPLPANSPTFWRVLAQ